MTKIDIGIRLPPKSSRIWDSLYLARRSAQAEGFDDAIMLDQSGAITELSAANLFIIQRETLITPVLTPEVFPGITREIVIEIAEAKGICVIERTIKLEDLHDMEAAFAASTLMEVRPIDGIDSTSYETLNHSLYNQIRSSFQEITHQ